MFWPTWLRSECSRGTRRTGRRPRWRRPHCSRRASGRRRGTLDAALAVVVDLVVEHVRAARVLEPDGDLAVVDAIAFDHEPRTRAGSRPCEQAGERVGEVRVVADLVADEVDVVAVDGQADAREGAAVERQRLDRHMIDVARDPQAAEQRRALARVLAAQDDRGVLRSADVQPHVTGEHVRPAHAPGLARGQRVGKPLDREVRGLRRPRKASLPELGVLVAAGQGGGGAWRREGGGGHDEQGDEAAAHGAGEPSYRISVRLVHVAGDPHGRSGVGRARGRVRRKRRPGAEQATPPHRRALGSGHGHQRAADRRAAPGAQGQDPHRGDAHADPVADAGHDRVDPTRHASSVSAAPPPPAATPGETIGPEQGRGG